MSIKRTLSFCSIIVLYLFVTAPAAYTQDFEMAKTYEEAIRKFPANLRSGFQGVYVVTTSNSSESNALTVLNAYLMCNWLKETFVLKGIGTKAADHKTVVEFYTENRLKLLTQITPMLPLIEVMGNPGGTPDWIIWHKNLTEWL